MNHKKKCRVGVVGGGDKMGQSIPSKQTRIEPNAPKKLNKKRKNKEKQQFLCVCVCQSGLSMCIYLSTRTTHHQQQGQDLSTHKKHQQQQQLFLSYHVPVPHSRGQVTIFSKK